MARMPLLGRLAQHGYLFSGEVAATCSLAVLMDHPALEAAFLDSIGWPEAEPLRWHAEHVVSPFGRLDVVGFSDHVPVVVIEAKFGAAFGDGQLQSYLRLMEATTPTEALAGSVLASLVPASRRERAVRDMESLVHGSTPVRCVVLTWEGVLDTLRDAAGEDMSLVGDVSQFASLVQVGLEMGFPPFDVEDSSTTISQRQPDLLKLIDLLSSRYMRASALAGDRLNPIQRSPVQGLAWGRFHWNSQTDPEFLMGVPEPASSMGRRSPLVVLVKTKWEASHGAISRLESAGLEVRREDACAWIPLEITPDIPPYLVLDQLSDQVAYIDQILRGAADPPTDA